MNIKITIIIGILFFSVAAMVYLPIGKAFAASATIKINNQLDVPLIFKEIKNRQDIQIITDLPNKINKWDFQFFNIKKGDSDKNMHLNIKYYVNNSDSGEQVGIVYKSDLTSDSCPKDHPDDISEEVKHCPSCEIPENWKYFFHHNNFYLRWFF